MTSPLALPASPDGRPLLVRTGRHRLEEADCFSTGYLVAHSATLVLLHRISDDLRLDGYEVLRRSDLTATEVVFPKRAFFGRVAELKEFRPVCPPGIDLESMPSALASIQRQFPLLVIHRELVAPTECEIGQIKLAGNGVYALKWMSPEAVWEGDSRHFRFADITRVGFGAEYETTLALVSGVAV